MAGTDPIIQFSGDPTLIQPGGCVRFCWLVEGVKAVYFHAEGERWQEHGVSGAGERQVCPSQSTTYCLRVIKPDDSVEVHRIAVKVQAPPETATARLFAADRLAVHAGECVTFRWHVEGAKAVYFYAEGESWQARGVGRVGEQQVCLFQTTTYRLRVVRRDDSVEVHHVTVLVQPTRDANVIRDFSVDKASIHAGDCATFRWHVEGVKAVYFHAEDQPWQAHGVAGVGEQQVCPPQTVAYCLRVVKRDDSVEVRKIAIRVQSHPETEVVQLFAVDREAIRAGECVTFRWRVEGVKAVYFHAVDNPWQDHGVAGVGEAQRCPVETTTYCLRVVKADDSPETHFGTVRVQGKSSTTT